MENNLSMKQGNRGQGMTEYIIITALIAIAAIATAAVFLLPRLLP